MLNVLLNHTPQCLTRDLVHIHVNSNLDSNTINNLHTNTNRDNRKVWSRIIRPTLTDRKGWALFIGTPKGPNLFSDLYHDCDKPENRREWQALKFAADETDRVSPEELESNRRAAEGVAEVTKSTGALFEWKQFLFGAAARIF
jgi:hypothetical protein